MPTIDPSPSEGYHPNAIDPYPSEGYHPATIDPYPSEGYQQLDNGNAYQIPQNYPQSPLVRSPEIVSYLATTEADQRKIISVAISEKLLSNDPSHKLFQGQYLNDRRIELEEQAERIEARQSIQEKLAANRAEHGRTEPAQNREKGIER